jgi:uncharacterized YkwD family protein
VITLDPNPSANLAGRKGEWIVLKKLNKQILTGVLALSVIGGTIGAGAASAAPASGMPKNSNKAQVQVYYGFQQVSLSQDNVAELLNGKFDLAKLQQWFPGLQLQVPDVTTPVTPTPEPEQPAPVTPAPTPKPEQPAAPTPKPEQPATPAPTPVVPTPTPVQPTQPDQATGAESSYANQVISLVNQERAKAGLQPVTSDAALTRMALDKAKDMYNNNYFDHTSPTFGSPFDMMKSYNITYRYAGENIAKGQRTPQEVMTAWMNSAGHRQNILSPNFTKIGVAYYNGEWVQEFTG